MGWVKSIGIALLTAILTLFGAGTVAGLTVDWHNISSFEGGSGFFVIGIALLGGTAGFVIGVVTSRVVAARSKPTFLKALGASAGVVALVLGMAAATSWLLADIPPEIDGEALFLAVEIRWPAAGASPPNQLQGVSQLRLGALSGGVARRLESGPFFIEDARQEDGRWIVPGAVPIFTSRGGRLLDVDSGGRSLAGFMVPLPRHPGEAQRQWSEWLPHARPGEPPLADQFTYRFKVIKQSEPVRTQTIGAFTVDTIANYFYYVGPDTQMAANATFSVRSRAQPIPGVATAHTVALVSAATPALFVTLAEPADDTPCALLIDDGAAVRVLPVRGCGTPFSPRVLTSDQSRFAAAKTLQTLPGWIDRLSFAQPGLFQLDAAILDTRDFTTATFLFPGESRPDTSVPPLDLSPDGQSFVWLVQGPDDQPAQLGVTNWKSSESYILPIDRARMRYGTEASLDPQWVQHHFAWTRGPKGSDVLVERQDFIVLPYRGELALGKPGEFQNYTLRPAGEPLRAAVVEILVRELGAEVLPDQPGVSQGRVRVKGKIVSPSVIGTPPYLSISMYAPDGDPELMSAIAATVDKAVATRKYDALFVAGEAK